MLCASTAWAGPPGDVDDDCDVDTADFVELATCMTGPCAPDCDPPLDPNCAPLDFDADGDLDLADFASFQLAFTGGDLAAELIALDPHRHILVNAGETVQLAVTALYASQCGRDVTADATFVSDDALIADVSPAGLITAMGDGETLIRAQYLSMEAVCAVTVTTQDPNVYPESGWIDGVVYDASAGDAPLAGAVITIKDHDTPITGRVITGADGRFSFPTPGRGLFFVTIAKNGYTYNQRRIEVTQTLDSATRPIYLLQEDPPLRPISSSGSRFQAMGKAVTGTLYANPANTVQIIWPDDAPGPRGRDVPGSLGATEVSRSLELADELPEQSEFTYAYCFDLGEDELPEPVIVRFVNDRGFAPGTEIPVGRWNNDLLKWVHETVGTVSPDGHWVEYEADSFSWHDINLPAIPPPQAQEPKLDDPSTENVSEPERLPPPGTCSMVSGGSVVSVRTGELFEDHALPSYRSLGAERAVRLVYQSRAAKPAAFISYDLDLDPASTLAPEAHGFRVSIEGQFHESWMQGTEDPRRHAFMWDGRNDRGELLPTGCYFYYLRLVNEYRSNFATSANGLFGGSAGDDLGVAAPERVVYPSSTSGTVMLRNDRSSLLGAGWSVGGIERLFVDPAQTRAVLVEGDGTTITFKAGQDLAVACTSGGISVLLGNGDGTFQNEQRFVTGGPLEITVGDFNGDGQLDLAATLNLRTEVSVLLGNGDGTFQSEQRFVTGRGLGITVGDFNGDGRQDLATANYSSNDVSVLLGNGDGTFQIEQRFAAGSSPRGITVGDFNGDGQHDLATADHSSNDVSVLLGNGDGTFQNERRFAAGSSPYGITIGDFNGDGRQDLATANYSSNDISVLLSNGDGTFQNEQRFAAGSSLTGITVGDLNGDGRQDLTATRQSSVAVSVLLGNGDGTFQSVQQIPVGTDSHVGITVADFDGDDRLDLATPGVSFYNMVWALLGNGDGTFQGSQAFMVGARPWGITTGDFDRTNGVFVSPKGEHSRLQRNPDATFTRTMKDGKLHHFDSDGLLTSTVDRNGKTTTYEYTGSGQEKKIWRITDPAGLVTAFAYDGEELESITDPAGRVTQFEIDASGDLVTITNPDLTERYFEYDDEHLLTAQIDAGGTRTEYVYDPYGCVTEVIKAVGTPDEQHRFFQASINQGLINDLPPGVGTRGNPAPPVNPNDIRESYTNGENETEWYYTNPSGALTVIEDALGRITEREISSCCANVTRVTFPEGNEIGYEYDQRGNRTKVINHGIDPPAETLIEYHETWNRPTRIEDPEQHVWLFDYDPNTGDLLAITDPMTRQTVATYNARGQVESIANAEGEVIQFTYYDDPNETGNLHQIIVDPNGLNLVTTLEYDAYGNVSRIVDAETNDTEYVHDVMNLLRFVTDAEDHITEYQYEAALGTVSRWASAPLANLKKIIDARPIDAVTFTYDNLHRTETETNAIGKGMAVQLRRCGPIGADSGSQEPDDHVHLRRRRTAHDEDGMPTPTGPEDVIYEYDLNGNLTRAADADSDLSFGFDTADRLDSYSSAAVAGQPALSLSYTYHDDGVLDTMVDPTGTTTYVHNDNHWLTQLTDPAGRVVGLGHDLIGRRTSTSYDNGTSVVYTFDDAGRLTDLVHSLAATPFLTLAYTHDDVGNILTMTDSDGLHTYGYDLIYQLTSALHPNPGVNPNESFTYDPVGNRLTSHLSSSHVHDDANRLLEDDDFMYVYDDNGNLETKTAKVGGALTTYTYDAENWLTRVDLPGGSWADYRYDSLGRRIEKNVNGVITRYTYDAEDILFEYDGSNNVLARYTHGPGIDEPLMMARDLDANGSLESVYHYHADHLGTIRTVTDDVGAAAQAYTYDTFGQIVTPDRHRGESVRLHSPRVGCRIRPVLLSHADLRRSLRAIPASRSTWICGRRERVLVRWKPPFKIRRSNGTRWTMPAARR